MADAFVVWVTGPPASGKSTLAAALAALLRGRGLDVAVLESDAVRRVVTPEPAYSPQERDLFYRALGYTAGELSGHGVPVIVDATAHRRRYRDLARSRIGRFLEVWVDCPLSVCQARDPKGIYAAAARSRSAAATTPGLGEPYEPPLRPEVVVRGDRDSPRQGARRVVAALRKRGWISRPRAPAV